MKPQGRNQSSVNFSHLRLISKRNSNANQDSSKKSGAISKYLVSTKKSEANHSVAGINSNNEHIQEGSHNATDECPYKNSLTDIKTSKINSSISEETDFQTPKRINRKTFQMGQNKNNVGKKSGIESTSSNDARKRGRKPKDNKKSKQMILTKTVKENLSSIDVNQEHLELAIALSRSLHDNGNSKCENEQNNDHTPSTSTQWPSTQQQVATIKQTLIQFGFKRNTNKIDALHRRTPVERRKKKSNFQYITPILFLRTQEDRERIISEKVAMIQLNNVQESKEPSGLTEDWEPKSEDLQKLWNYDKNIYKMCSLQFDALKNSDIFYVKSLNISSSESKCGSSLKDWAKIPGREVSPVRILEKTLKNVANPDKNQLTNNSAEDLAENNGSNCMNLLLAGNTSNSDKVSVLGRTFANNLKMQSFSSNRSVSPNLFDSDDEVVEISAKEKIISSAANHHKPQPILNLTPRKNKFHYSSHSSPEKDIASDDNSNSESLLKITPTKKKNGNNLHSLNKNKTAFQEITSTLFTNKSNENFSFRTSGVNHSCKEQSRSSDLSDGEFLENDNSTEKSLSPSANNRNSQEALLNLTPRKNASYYFIHSSPEKDCASDENCNSESLLKITPTKKKNDIVISNLLEIDKDKLGIKEAISPLFTSKSKENLSINSSKRKCSSSDLSDDDLFENDNGICTFESFAKENDDITQNYFDLTQSSNEENHTAEEENNTNIAINLPHSSNDIPDVKVVSFENKKIIQSSLTTGISEIMQKSLDLYEENMMTDSTETVYKTIRRSKSLNITEYVCNMLDGKTDSFINNSQQDEVECMRLSLKHCGETDKDNDEEVFDLTQSSTESENAVLSPVKLNREESTSTFGRHDSFKSTTSQESVCISDEELNYSSTYGTPYNNKKKQSLVCKGKYLNEFSDNGDSGGNNLNNVNSDFTPKTSKDHQKTGESSTIKSDLISGNNMLDDCNMVIDSPMKPLTESYIKDDNQLNLSFGDNQPILQHSRTKNLSRENTPMGAKLRKSLFEGANFLDYSFSAVLENPYLFNDTQTSEAGPSNTTNIASETQDNKPDETNVTPKSEMIIKSSNITPITNYSNMNTPQITKELQKLGIKPLKRQRGIQILKHIYESTHPVVGQTENDCKKSESDEDYKVIKKRKTNVKVKDTKNARAFRKYKSMTAFNENPEKNTNDKLKYGQTPFVGIEEKIEVVGDLITEKQESNWMFERKQSTKISSCRVPLHIAWHNLISSQPELRKNILLYEPLQLEVLYNMLKEQGYKYHIQDVLTFLDKKCITVRTNQTQGRKRQRGKKSTSPQKCTNLENSTSPPVVNIV